MIQLKNISKAFSNQSILENISLEIRDGSRFCLLGGSGSGKSVTIKLILGLEELDGGELLIDGKSTLDFKPEDWQECLSNFGVVFQGAALFDSLNVLRNVGIKLFEERQYGLPQIEALVVEALEAVNLGGDILQKYPSQLSGGMKKRVAIARAILHKPKYLVYDEPTTGLDPISAAVIDDLIQKLSEESDRTSIIITHDMHTVENIASDVAMIYDRKILFDGSRAEFFNSEIGEIKAFLKRS
ncbi:MAG: ATP-binding cassette domain-containing protein [Bacteroidota bacterium]